MSERPDHPETGDDPVDPTRPDEPPELEALLEELFAGSPTETDEPSPEELLAFVRGELDDDARDRLLQGIADHPEAMDLLLELRRAEAGNAGSRDRAPYGLSGRVEGVMDRLAGRMAADRAHDAAGSPARDRVGAPPGMPHREPRAVPQAALADPGTPRPTTVLPRRRSGWPWAAAAALVLSSTIFGILQLREAERLRHELADPEPRVATGVSIVDLFPTEHLRGAADGRKGDGADAAVSLSAEEILSAPVVTLALTPGDPVPSRAYHLRILDPEGGEAWGGPAAADPSGAVVVSVPSALLSPGLWRFLLRPVAEQEELSVTAEAPTEDPAAAGAEELLLHLRGPRGPGRPP